jgi:copper chaperone
VDQTISSKVEKESEISGQLNNEREQLKRRNDGRVSNNKIRNSSRRKFSLQDNCSGCVAKVTPALNEASGIAHWEVNTNSKEKILTVQSGGITQEQVMEVVKKSGFQITAIGS